MSLTRSISRTLNNPNMPLEDAVLKLAAAVEANTAALLNKPVPASAPEDAPAEEAIPRKGRKPKAEVPETLPPAPTPETLPPAPPAGPTLSDLRAAAQAVLDGNGNDPAPIAAINKEYGVKRISEIAPERYAEAIAKLKAIKPGAI